MQILTFQANVRLLLFSPQSVQTRLSSSTGMSFTEFTYQLMQAYDFYHLNRHAECTIQLGGSDQWGNIVAGLDLIHHSGASEGSGSTPGDHLLPGQGPNWATQQRAYGITTPLLLTAAGEKFGKSAGNAVWLNPKETSELDFYQFFLRTADADVSAYLRMFTLLEVEDIEAELKIHAVGTFCLCVDCIANDIPCIGSA